MSAVAAPQTDKRKEEDTLLPTCQSLESLSLGGVAAMNPHKQLPKKYREAQAGEKSTFQGAGVVPVTRLENGEVKILLWQPQSGSKKGVRWYDFGGKKESKAEFTSACAARKFVKQTYGIFGTNIDLSSDPQQMAQHLRVLYQGLANLPLMLHTSAEWAKLQLCDDNIKMFYNDIHEYHCYLLLVPYLDEQVLNQVSQIVDGGKRVFRWLSREDVQNEVLAPRLHTESFLQQVDVMPDDPWIRHGKNYGDGVIGAATGTFCSTKQ